MKFIKKQRKDRNMRRPLGNVNTMRKNLITYQDPLRPGKEKVRKKRKIKSKPVKETEEKFSY